MGNPIYKKKKELIWFKCSTIKSRQQTSAKLLVNPRLTFFVAGGEKWSKLRSIKTALFKFFMGWGESNLRKSFGTIDFFVRCAHNCTFVTLAENEFHRYVGIEQRNCRKSFVKGWNGTHKYIYSTKTFSQTDENERVHFTPFFMGAPSRNGGSPSLLPLLWGVNFPLFFPNANRQPEPLY